MNQNPQYTVLRIKRKANEPPLSSLVIEEPGRARKRRNVKRGVFRLADTVPGSWEGSGPQADQLRERIQGLLQVPVGHEQVLGQVPLPAPLDSLPQSSTAAGSEQGRTESDERQGRPGPTPLSQRTGSSRQFRVVPRAQAHDPNLPPRVITNAEIEAARSALQFIDAQAVSDEGQEKEMSAFQDMLTEYLKLEGSSEIKKVNDDDDDDYVYDLYYRDLNGGGVEGASIGALLGYEDLSPPSTPPDSEPEDEADEDSNDEDFYRNDYPEDEDADEDMVGFEDAYSDGEWSRDDEEEERDLWDYR